MLPSPQGSFRLFTARGIEVFVHWSWFLIAAYSIQTRMGKYSSPVWMVWEYLALFAIVLLHEFGHSLACRSVGGHADRIVLWPLGGVAFVQPPPRPGAVLWSIAAGPLVNVALFPVMWLLRSYQDSAAWATPDTYWLFKTLFEINTGLLIFNLLPVYPLDGGQILRAVLWFPLGPLRSLYVATSIGFLGVIGLGFLAWHWQSLWLGILAAFIFSNNLRAFQQARAASAGSRIYPSS